MCETNKLNGVPYSGELREGIGGEWPAATDEVNGPGVSLEAETRNSYP